MKEVEESHIGGETVEQRAVKAIHCLAEEAEKSAKKEEERGGIQDFWPLGQESFIVGSATFDDFDLCHIRLEILISRGRGRRSDRRAITWLMDGLFSTISKPFLDPLSLLTVFHHEK